MDNIEEKSFEYSSSNDYSSLNEEAPSAVDGKDKISELSKELFFQMKKTDIQFVKYLPFLMKAVKFY